MANVLYLYGMETTYFRFRDPKNAPHVFSQALSMVLTTSGVLSVSIFLFSVPLSAFLGSKDYIFPLRIISFILFLDALAALPLARLRVENKAMYFALCRLAQAAIQIGLVLFWLWFCPYALNEPAFASWHAWIGGVYKEEQHMSYLFLANACACVVYIPMLWRFFMGIHWRFVWRDVRQMGAYAMPLLGVGLMGVCIESLPRVLFKYLHAGNMDEALTDLGIYSASAKLAMIMLMGIQAYRYAFEPFILTPSSGGGKQAGLFSLAHKKRLILSQRYFIYFATWIFVGICVFSSFLAKILIPEKVYQGALHLVPVLVLSYVFFGMYYHFSSWYKIRKMTIMGFYFSLIGLLISFWVAFIFVPFGGYEALAWGTFFAYGGMAWAAYSVGQRYYAVSYGLLRPLLGLLAGIFLVFLHQVVFSRENTGMGHFIWVSFIFVLYTIGMAWFSGVWGFIRSGYGRR